MRNNSNKFCSQEMYHTSFARLFKIGHAVITIVILKRPPPPLGFQGSTVCP